MGIETANEGMMAKPMGDPELLKMVGENLARARGRRSQSEIAEASGVDISTISDIENGRRNPSVTTVAQLAAAVGVDVEDLFRRGNAKAAGRPGALETRVAALERDLLVAMKLAKKALELGQQPGAVRSPARPRRGAS